MHYICILEQVCNMHPSMPSLNSMQLFRSIQFLSFFMKFSFNGWTYQFQYLALLFWNPVNKVILLAFKRLRSLHCYRLWKVSDQQKTLMAVRSNLDCGCCLVCQCNFTDDTADEKRHCRSFLKQNNILRCILLRGEMHASFMCERERPPRNREINLWHDTS